MSESLLSFTIIFAELGGVLLLVVIGWVIYIIYRIRREAINTRKLIEQVKALLPVHQKQLENYFKDGPDFEDKKTELNIKSLMTREKKFYNSLINVSINNDMSLLSSAAEDINNLINDYVRLLRISVVPDTVENKASRDLSLKKENETLRLENTSLKSRLEKANETIENMMGEFSSMYEGGKKEGEQRVKNEMYKLQQSLKEEEIKVKKETRSLDKKHDDAEN